jgi:hypothetical protein
MAVDRVAINEEIDFFKDICGWSDERVEQRLGLADGTLAQRKHRQVRREREAAK